MVIYEYMIVYSFKGGVGRTRLDRTETINSYSELEEVDKFIGDKNGLDNLFVTDFKLLRTYKSESKGD